MPSMPFPFLGVANIFLGFSQNTFSGFPVSQTRSAKMHGTALSELLGLLLGIWQKLWILFFDCNLHWIKIFIHRRYLPSFCSLRVCVCVSILVAFVVSQIWFKPKTNKTYKVKETVIIWQDSSRFNLFNPLLRASFWPPLREWMKLIGWRSAVPQLVALVTQLQIYIWGRG